MAEPFLGEIKLMSFGFAPRNWAQCDGQLLPINQHQALFALIGITYGGNGMTNFALPDLRGRVPIHAGTSRSVGERGGEQAHVLSIAELPAHRHELRAATGSGSTGLPTGAMPGAAANLYGRPSAAVTSLSPAAVTSTGGSQAHLNMQPFLTLAFCIALAGIFPSPS